MKRISKTILSILIAAIMLVTFAVPVFASSTSDANEPIDTGHACSLTLIYEYEGDTMPGLELKLYKVADFTADYQFNPVERFAEKGIAITGIKSQSDWDKLSSTLSALIALEKPAPDAEATTDEDGKGIFPGLTTGLYFTDQQRVEKEDGTIYTFKSVLVAVPAVNADGTWNYDVSATPKVDVYVPEKIYIDYRVNKLWKDQCNEDKRPASVSVTILKNGSVYEEITLDAKVNWTYTWTVEDDGSVYQVIETNVPENYTMTADSQGNVFSITNTYKPETPPETPPQTGDTFDSGIWIFAMSVSGILLVLTGVFMMRKRREEE